MATNQGVTIGAKITMEGGEAKKTLADVKRELKEAKGELIDMQEKFGQFSPEAMKAAQAVAELKDQIKDANDLAASFNPEKKFAAFGNSVQGVVGGFAALQGVMGMVGAEGEEVNAMLLKVQSALAISQGLDQFRAAIEDFKTLGGQIKATTLFTKANEMANKAAAVAAKFMGTSVEASATSFKVLKGAIAATGIGLLLVALGEGISLLQSWTGAAEEAAERQKQLNDQILAGAKAQLEGSNAFIEREASLEEARAKAKGASEKEIFEIQQRWQRQRVNAAVDYWKEVKDNDKENYKAKEEAEKQAVKLEVDKQNFIAQERQKAEAKEKERRQKALEKLKADKQKEVEAEREAEKLIEELKTTIRADRAKTESESEIEKLKGDFEVKKKVLEKGHKELNTLETWYEEERGRILRKADDEARKKALETIDERIKAEEEAKQKQIENQQKQIDAYREAAATLATNTKMSLSERAAAINAAEQGIKNNTKLNEDERTAYESELTKARITLAEEERTAKVGFYQEIGGALGTLGDIVGKQTAAGKALGIAQATINTWIGVTEVLKTKSVLPEPMATISRIVNVGAVIASGLSAVKNIVKTQVPGAGGGGGATPSLNAPINPAPQATVTSLDRDSINAVGNGAVKAYVVEQDVTNNQEKIERINRAARIG